MGIGIQKPDLVRKRLKDCLKRLLHILIDQNPLMHIIKGMSVLERYIHFTADSGVEISGMGKSYQEMCKRYGFDMREAGTKVMESATMYDAIDSDAFLHFVRSRHSVRSYEKRPVEKDVMESVLAIAASSPSACNCQPIRVFWTNSDASVDRISKGNKSFEDAIPNWGDYCCGSYHVW